MILLFGVAIHSLKINKGNSVRIWLKTLCLGLCNQNCDFKIQQYNHAEFHGN